MTYLTEQAIEDAIKAIESLSIKPGRMVLDDRAIQLMTDAELSLITTEGLGALPEARRKELVSTLMQDWGTR